MFGQAPVPNNQTSGRLQSLELNTPAPGSSLPSGQSQESSFTNAHGISFDPSKHFQFPLLSGAYFDIRSGLMPNFLSTPARIGSGRGRSSSHGSIAFNPVKVRQRTCRSDTLRQQQPNKARNNGWESKDTGDAPQHRGSPKTMVSEFLPSNGLKGSTGTCPILPLQEIAS